MLKKNKNCCIISSHKSYLCYSVHRDCNIFTQLFSRIILYEVTQNYLSSVLVVFSSSKNNILCHVTPHPQQHIKPDVMNNSMPELLNFIDHLMRQRKESVCLTSSESALNLAIKSYNREKILQHQGLYQHGYASLNKYQVKYCLIDINIVKLSVFLLSFLCLVTDVTLCFRNVSHLATLFYMVLNLSHLGI